jgi:acetyltransferase-like isoleucine patch superfamily enzyme
MGSVNPQVTTGQPIEHGDNIHIGQSVYNGYNIELASPLMMGPVNPQVTTGQPIGYGDNIHIGQSVYNGYNLFVGQVGWPMCNGELSTWLVS